MTHNGVARKLDSTDTTAMQVYSAISNSGIWYWYDNTTPRYVIEYTKATNVLRLLAETGTVAMGALTATSALVSQIPGNGVAITPDRTDTTAMQVYSAISNSGVWYWYDNTTPRYVIEYTKATNVLRLLAETGTVAMGALTATSALVNQITGNGVAITLDRTDTTAMQVYSAI